MEQTLNPDVEFASKVIGLSFEGYEMQDVFTGLALSVASLLVDEAINEDQVISEDSLESNTKVFSDTLAHAITFVRNHFESSKVEETSV